MQGEWKPKQIDNPNYKGAWVHPEIDNPEYSPDSNIYKFDNIGVIGLDLWQVREKRRSSLNNFIVVMMLELQCNICYCSSQVKSGTIFDNVLITDDVKEAEDIGMETWGMTKVCGC